MTARLEAAGFRVFLPQREGVGKGAPPYDAMTPDQRREATFILDRDKIFEADVFLFLLDGRVPDEGACVELGLAYCYRELRDPGKLLVGLHTDHRAAFFGSRLNPMVGVPLERVFANEDELLEVLEDHGEQGP